ncbi:MAG: NPCBM/NEW2 domain-containing protein [Lentisphaeraceae bacterium]|nr:NPCBM/NEW2 domain-containing protein [Lentisphaeraceae bacterium]
MIKPLVYFLLSISLSAGFVKTKDGKVLTGQVNLAGSTLEVNSKKMSLDKVSSFERDLPLIPNTGEFLILTNGSLLKGKAKKIDTKNSTLSFEFKDVERSIKRSSIAGLSFGGSKFFSASESKSDSIIMNNGEIEKGSLAYFTNTMLGFSTRSIKRYKKSALSFIVLNTVPKSVDASDVKIFTTSREIIAGRLESIKDGKVTIKNAAGTFIEDLQRIVRFEKQSTNSKSLVTLKPTSVEQQAYFNDVLKPQFNKTFTQSTVVLRELPIKNFISIHSKTVMNYDLNKKYSYFSTEAFIDENALNGDLTLVLNADGKELFKQQISSGHKPVSISVPLKGKSKFTITVDYGKRGSGGDYLILARPELIQE